MYTYVCYRCLPFHLATRPGFHVTHIPKGNLVQAHILRVYYFNPPADREKKAQAHHTSTNFHTRRVSILLNCIRNPALASVSFISRDSYSASCSYRWFPLLLRQRKLTLYTDA